MYAIKYEDGVVQVQMDIPEARESDVLIEIPDDTVIQADVMLDIVDGELVQRKVERIEEYEQESDYSDTANNLIDVIKQQINSQ